MWRTIPNHPRHGRGSHTHQEKRCISTRQGGNSGGTESPCRPSSVRASSSSSSQSSSSTPVPLRQNMLIRRGTRRALPGVTLADGSQRKRSRRKAKWPTVQFSRGAPAAGDIPPLIRKVEWEPGVGQRSPSCG